MNRIYKFFELYYVKQFTLITGLASVVGILYLLFSNTINAIIALVAFIVFLIIILFRFFSLTNSFLTQKTKDGYSKFANYIFYSTTDGKFIDYQVHRFIQCKCPIMSEYIHEFHWSGTKPPKVSSMQHIFKKIVSREKDGDFDKAVFRFKRPLIYNEFAIIDIKMDLDDSNMKSKHHIGHNVIENIQLINFVIDLKHLASHPNATVSRRAIDSRMPQEFDFIESIVFDEKTRSYRYSIFNPEPGYNYRIDWQH